MVWQIVAILLRKMQQISIIINDVKGQFDNVIVVIYVSRNPYDIAYVNFVLLDAEEHQSDIFFDSANAVVNQLSSSASPELLNTNMKNFQVPSSTGDVLLLTPPNQPPFQHSNSGRGRGRGRGCGYGNNKMQCQLCGKFGHLVHRCYH